MDEPRACRIAPSGGRAGSRTGARRRPSPACGLASARESARALAVVLALAAAACDARRTAAQDGAAALARNLARAPALEIHVADAQAARGAERLAARERARGTRRVEVVVDAEGDPRAARLVIGVAGTPQVEALAARAGLAASREPAPRFRAHDVEHDGPADAARATFEDPSRPGLPVTLWLGNDLELLFRQIDGATPRSTPDLATWRGGEPALSVRAWPDGSARAGEIARLGVARLALRGPPGTTLAREGVLVEPDFEIAADAAARVLAEIVAARARAAEWVEVPLPDVRVLLASGVEEYRLAGEHARLGRWNRALPAAEMLVLGGITDGGAAAVRATLREALGPAASPWIEDGASVAAAGSWFGRDLDRWIARLELVTRRPSTAELLDPAADARVTPHALAPLRAALFEHVRALRGAGHVRALWTGARSLELDAQLETSFSAALEARAAPHRAEVRQRAQALRDAALRRELGAGVTLAAHPLDPRAGYGTRAGRDVLVGLAAAGARSVVLRADFAQRILPDGADPARAYGPLQGDVALYATLLAARAEGLVTALAAHLLASDAGSYALSWSPASEAEWGADFARFARAVEHAGLLANLAGADWLVLGGGLAAVSGEDPDERRVPADAGRWRREAWRSVVGAARGAFPGAITYAASGVPELAAIRFWPDLDAIGLDLAPRAGRHAPDARAELAAQMTHALQVAGEVARQAARPIVVTEASFAPVRARAAQAPIDWAGAQLGLLSEELEAARAAGVDVRGVWIARASSAAGDRGFGAGDLVIVPAARAAELARITAAFRTGPRSPR